MRKFKGKFICDPDCEFCEGKGYIVDGMEGFINSRMEQDCRDTYSPCEKAEFIEPDYPDRREEE